MNKEYELRPVYDSRASFYKKAQVITNDDIITLRSYNTNVAYIKDGKAFVRGAYSHTTLRHIKDFLQQHGFVADKQSQILKDYKLEGREDDSPTRQSEDNSPLKDHMKSVSLVCALGNLMCDKQKDKNSFSKRMMGTLPGIQFPDDWDSLSEEEKQRRLEGGLKQIA